VLELFGVQKQTERVYQAMLAHPRADVATLATHLNLAPAEVSAELDRLAEIMLVQPDGDQTYLAVAPDLAIESLLTREEVRLAEMQAQMTRGRGRVTDYVESYVQSRIQRDDLGLVEVVDERVVVRSRLYQLVRQARRSSVAVLPHGPLPIGSLERSARLDEELLARRVATRVVVAESSLSVPYWREHLQAQAALGVQTRVHATPPLQMILIDDDTAIIPRTEPEGGALILHGTDLVAPVLALSDMLWERSEPLSLQTPDNTGDDELSEARIRQVVTMLAQGLKDEAIARRMGVSVRTVRRLVSAAVATLHAESRFQAGVEAVRQGWVD
jgi:DNA-binding CsgD family transcriptional regulator